MIILGKNEKQVHRASWHNDEEICQRQGAVLAADVLATREKLLKQTLQAKFGYLPAPSRCAKSLHEVHETATGLVWILWDDEAIAVRTEPKSSVKNCIYSVEWYFKSLVTGKN